MSISLLLTGPNSTKPAAKPSPSGMNGDVDPGVSIRFGPVQDKDIEMEDADSDARAASKRKSRTSIDQKKSYTEPESSDDDDQPLVRSVITAQLDP